MLYHIVIGVFLFLGYWTVEVYIAGGWGNDSPGCGNSTKTPCKTLLYGAYQRSGKMRNAVVDIFLECHGNNDNTAYRVTSRFPMRFYSNQSISLQSYNCSIYPTKGLISGDFSQDANFVFSIYDNLGSPTIRIEGIEFSSVQIIAFYQNETFVSSPPTIDSTKLSTTSPPLSSVGCNNKTTSKIHIRNCNIFSDSVTTPLYKYPFFIISPVSNDCIPNFEFIMDNNRVIRGKGNQFILVPPNTINLTISINHIDIWDTLFKLNVATGSFSLQNTNVKSYESEIYDIIHDTLIDINNFDDVDIFNVTMIMDSDHYFYQNKLWITNSSKVQVNLMDIHKDPYATFDETFNNNNINNYNNNNNNNHHHHQHNNNNKHHHHHNNNNNNHNHNNHISTQRSLVDISYSDQVVLKDFSSYPNHDLHLYHNKVIELNNVTLVLNITDAINVTMSKMNFSGYYPLIMSSISQNVIIRTSSFNKFWNTENTMKGVLSLDSAKSVVIDHSTFDCYYYSTFYFGSAVLNVSITNAVINSPKPNSHQQETTPPYNTIMNSNAHNLYLENVTMTVYNTIAQNDFYSAVPPNFSNFTFICPNSSNPFKTENGQILACQYCSRGEYSLQHGHYSSNDETHSLEVHSVNCLPCPLGGYCDKTISSKANFWGFVIDREQIVSFIPCPSQYCCKGTQQNPCVGLDTCAPNRVGRICGQCKEDHYIDLFSAQCVPAKKCADKRFATVALFAGAVLLYVFLVCLSVNFVELFSCCNCIETTTNSSNIGESQKTEETPANTTMVVTTTNIIVQDNEEDHQGRSGDTDERAYLLRNPCSSDQEQETMTLNDEGLFATTNNSNENTGIVSNRQNNNWNDTISKRRPPAENSGTAVGIFKILVNFYQLNSLIRIASFASLSKDQSTTNRSVAIQTITSVIDGLFNLRLEVDNALSSYCLTTKLDVTLKLFVKDFLFSGCAIAFTLILINLHIDHTTTTATTRRGDTNSSVKRELKTKTRMKIAAIQMILIGFSNMASFALQMTNCVTVNDQSYLYISGNMKCSESNFYVFSLCYLVLISAPFSISMYFAIRMLEFGWINTDSFIASLVFPPFTMVFYVERRWIKKYVWGKIVPDTRVLRETARLDNNMQSRENAESKWVLSVLRDPFREDVDHNVILWDPILIFRRFVVSIIVTFSANPLIRLCILAPFLLFFLVHHHSVFVYKSTKLNWLETFYMTCLCFLSGGNMIRGFVYVYNLPFHQTPLSSILEFYDIFEDVLLALPVLCGPLVLIYWCFTYVVT